VDSIASARASLGSVGIWASLDAVPIGDVLRFATTVEDLGFPALWINESSGRDPFAVLGALARATSRLTLGVGVASVYARDAVGAHGAARTIADLSGGRFVMGLGVSHRSSAGARGHDYGPPLATMSAYLDAYASARWTGPAVDDPPVVLAALGPRMTALAGARAAGAFPFLVTAAQVVEARRMLDAAADAAGRPERPLLVAPQFAILGDGEVVRDGARGVVRRYIGHTAYRDNLLRGGFTDAEIEGCADRMVNALVATGDPASLLARIAAMHAAGADHVAVIPLSPQGRPADLPTTLAVAPDRPPGAGG
jgi:probable F420-dependent oxidoreductase